MTDRRLTPLIALMLCGCPSAPDDAATIGAPGVTIDQIAIYQGVKRTLVVGGEPVDSDVPLIAGRDALVRVFYSTDDDYDGGEVGARLELGDAVVESTPYVLLGSSSDDDLRTTVNIEVDGADVGDVLDWSVQLVQEATGEDNPSARYPESGTVSLEADGEVNVLRIVIAPFAYNFDGSGRIPDTSPEQIDRIRETFLKLYPVSDVELTIRDPQPWSSEILPTGEGWVGPGISLLGFRNADSAPDDVYYYGMFNPTETIGEFCQLGCLLGVTLLNDEPEDAGSVSLRLALGVGFTEQAPAVAAHEIGHAHGRAHAPCGPPGNPPDGPDPDYPYDDGSIGVWGYDIVEGELHPPTDSDVMSYCDDQWVSDFTYGALHRRGQNVNEGWSLPLPPQTWDVIVVDGSGGATWATSTERTRGVSGEPVEVTLLAAGGAPTAATGRFVRYDHLPGGWLLVPRGELPAIGAEFVIDGGFVRVER